ncbi:bifunctional DNA primase/polymerase [Streptomyces sp. ISL-43]|uniref:bifunctional DNA primase/polymerase n=1 Tax=Streptomyces sp. ISL-43 TaxID=2819183 RepID=UPI001BE72D6A|nr:bifunctional DNA primase/polymerase [Streptomyces sp. ISL-43]MBT2446154.1 bifunctional DNA primase/polymerase [Streptomyces sp. ISL-43]
MHPDLGSLPSRRSTRRPATDQFGPGRGSLDTALWCARQGWPVHPLAPGRKTPAANCQRCRSRPHGPDHCACLREGRWCHGFHAATSDPDLITAWWRRQPHFGVGVACGPAGLVVIDVDAHPAPLPGHGRLLPGIHIPDTVRLDGLRSGFHSLALLAALRGQDDPVHDATTLRVRTPSGGTHLWYRADPAPSARPWRCSTGSGSGRALAWQVDVRAHGGYIIAPGTRTAAGTYTPYDPASSPAPLPGWLAAELERTGHRPAPPSPRTAPAVPARGRAAVAAAGGYRGGAATALAAVLASVTDCAQAPQGTGFTEKLNRAAFTVGGLVGAGRMSPAEAEAALMAAAEHARPGREHHSLRIVRNGMSAGTRRPLYAGALR